MSVRLQEHEHELPALDVSELTSKPDDFIREDREWAEAVLAGERRVLEMIARSSSLDSILEALCLLVEQTSSNCLAAIPLLDAEGQRLFVRAAPSLPRTFADAIHRRRIADSWGPCGIAAARKRAVILSDIKTDSPCAEYRDLALAHGLQACWSMPVLSFDGKVLGTFAVYCRDPRTPTPRQSNLLEQFAHLASIAIERTRGQEALRRSQSYLAEAQKLSHTGSFGWNVSTGELIWSDETFNILGYDPALKPTLDLVLQRVHPEDIPLVKQMINLASHETTNLDFEHRVVMPDGLLRHLHVIAHPVKNSAGELEFVGAVMDVTDRRQAAEALRASAQVACGQVNALTSTLDALAKESAPDRLVEHVLRTITEQLSAHSCSIWLRIENTDEVRFEFAFEEGKLLTGSATEPSFRINDVPPWPEIFRTGKPGVVEDARQGPPVPWREHVVSLGVVTILVVPMLIAGRVEGVVGVRFTEKRTFPPEEMLLAQALAHQATLACQLRRLARQSRQAAVMAERNRMARDIHDTLAQGFTGIILQLEAIEEALSQGLSAKAEEFVARAAVLARESLQEARRSVQALRPQTLMENDLREALQRLTRKMTADTAVRAKFDVTGNARELPHEWDENLLRIGQEVLTNALRHAQARNFNARLAFEDAQICLTLSDDGQGFDPAARHEGFGLQGIRERVETMGGRLSIQSTHRQGTTISIVLPLPKTQVAS